MPRTTCTKCTTAGESGTRCRCGGRRRAGPRYPALRVERARNARAVATIDRALGKG